MLALTPLEEFRGKRLKGTAIKLFNEPNTGATQIAAQEFLEIIYPQEIVLHDGAKPAGLFHLRIT